jgi:hypothetical protein
VPGPEAAASKCRLLLECPRSAVRGLPSLQAVPAARYKRTPAGVGRTCTGSGEQLRSQDQRFRVAGVGDRSLSRSPVFSKTLWDDLSGLLQSAPHGRRPESASAWCKSGRYRAWQRLRIAQWIPRRIHAHVRAFTRHEPRSGSHRRHVDREPFGTNDRRRERPRDMPSGIHGPADARNAIQYAEEAVFMRHRSRRE